MKVSTFLPQFAFVLTALTPQAFGQFNIEAEKLVDFIGCNSGTTTPAAIRDAWDSAMDIAWVSSGKIEWDWQRARDYLGPQEKNGPYQNAIKTVLNAAYTYHRSYWWNPPSWRAWETSIRCDDFHGVCRDNPGSAAAYTVNPGERPDGKQTVTKDTIVICPDVFNSKDTCSDALKKSDPLHQGYNMKYFQCRGYVILHELFHLDSLSKRGGAGHISDLKFYTKNSKGYLTPTRAYGPENAKILANWPGDDVGQYVVTNADNLAQYSLAAWVQAKKGVYYPEPSTDKVPETAYTPRFFNKTDALENPDAPGWIEDNLDDPGFDTSANVGPDVLLAPDKEEYLDCNNNGNLEWATRPFVSQAFAQSSITTFCNAITNSKNIQAYPVSGSDRVLYLGAILEQSEDGCALSVSKSTCTDMLGKILNGCDTDSTSRKYGGVYHTQCTSWIATVNGTVGAVADPDVPFSCSVLPAENSVACACTDGEVYPPNNGACDYTTPPVGSTIGGGGQQVGIASYISPVGDPNAWSRMISYPSSKVTVLIANVLNGPDNTVSSSWKKVIESASASGKTVIGYVRTGYLGISQQGFTTRLGSKNLADWVSQIETDVDLWYSLYPGLIGGIFFDEGWNDCGPNNQYAELYRLITENTKRKYPGAMTVLNPGATMPQCFENSADSLMTFESDYSNYKNNFVSNGWTPKNTAKIWHIVYNVPQSEVKTIAALALQRGAGILQITDDVLPNPYDTLPNDAYMQELMGAVSGSTPGISIPRAYPGGSSAATPGGLTVTASDYSSVSLKWSAVANAISYKVYVNGAFTLNLASTMTSVTIGNLAVGKSGFTFQVTAVGGDGSESARSGAVTASTSSPPVPGQYILNAKLSASSAGSTTYKADVLVPYAFVRVYITNTVNGLCSGAAWPINYDSGHFVCAVYMVESGTLYKYSGPAFDGVTSPPWSWTAVGPVTVTQDRYAYTWTLPIGTSTVSPKSFVIQAEGYSPLSNYLQPCPLFATSSTYCSNS